MTDISGQSSTGKTQFCLSVCLHTILSSIQYENWKIGSPLNYSSVWYFDTCSSFSPNQILKIFENSKFSQDLKTTLKNESYQGILNNIICFDVFDSFEIINYLVQLENLLFKYHTQNLNNSKLDVSNLKLVIIDSFATIFLPYVTSKYPLGRHLMVVISQLMKTISIEYNIAFLITNYTAKESKNSSILKPALGYTWASIPDVKIMFSLSKLGIRTAKIFNSSQTSSSEKILQFEINSKGVDVSNY